MQYYRELSRFYNIKPNIMKISFFDREGTVQARINDSSKCLRISTGIKVGRHKFDGEFKGHGMEVIALNNELNRHRVMLSELYLRFGDLKRIKEHYKLTPELPSEDDNDLVSLIRKRIHEMTTSKSKRGTFYSPASIETYSHVANVLAKYCAVFGDIDITKYSIDHNWPMQKKRDVSDQFMMIWKGYEVWLIDNGYSLKSISEIINMTGMFVNHWAREMFLNLPKIPRQNKVKKPIVVLDPNFALKFIKDSEDVYGKLSPDMKTVWLSSAIIMMTTLRISDVVSLTRMNLRRIGDDVFLVKMNNKTHATTEVPLPKPLADKLIDNFTYGDIFPVKPTKKLIHGEMRNLFKMYEELHEVHSIQRVNTKGKLEEVSMPLWQWVHPHMLRKTAITTMLYMGIKDIHVKDVAGHSKNSTVLSEYYTVIDKYFKSDFKKMHEAI